MTRTSLLFAALALLTLGCESEPVPEPAAPGVGFPVADGTPREPSSGKGPQSSPLCDPVQEEARALLEEHGRCSEDEDCTVATLGVTCLPIFRCFNAVRAGDLEELKNKAQALSKRATESCEGCSLAKCAGPKNHRAFCNATTSRCSFRYEPPAKPDDRELDGEDAAVAARERDGGAATRDASADAGRAGSDAAVRTQDSGAGSSDPFACEQASDCVVKDVGNCCGYYPRCANVNASFERPDCSGGQAGVCGFPVIERCACESNKCVSLQAGLQI